MTDENDRGDKPFSWGLNPAQPQTPAPAPAPSAPAEPVEAQTTPPADPTPQAPPVETPDDDDGEPTAAFDFRAPAPPPVDPIQLPRYHAGQTLPWEQPPSFDPALLGATEVLGAELVGMDAPVDESAPTSALDSLFGEEKFLEYEDAPAQDLVNSLVPFAAKDKAKDGGSQLVVVPVAPPQPKGPRPPLPRSQRVLVWVAGGLVAALALAGLFFVGTRLPDATPAVVASPSPKPSASAPVAAAPAPVVLGPVAAGAHGWNDLLGTECLDPYVSPWEETFTVVDCAAPHAAQMVYRGRFDDSALDPFPGVDVLQARMNLLCASPENVDYAAASQFANIQIAASYPATDADWKSGNRNYFCFVNRASGERLTASVSTPPRAPVVIPVVAAPEP